MSKRFADRLSEELVKARNPAYDEGYQALREVADGIKEAVSRGKTGELLVELEPGYTTNLGQQFKLRMDVPDRKWGETLLRAYIPKDGFPIMLDLGDEEPKACRDATELDEAVLQFMKTAEIANRMSTVRELL